MAMVEPLCSHMASENGRWTWRRNARGSLCRQNPNQDYLKRWGLRHFSLRSSHLDLLTMTNLDIKLKLANTAATLILVGSHGFSFQDWYSALFKSFAFRQNSTFHYWHCYFGRFLHHPTEFGGRDFILILSIVLEVLLVGMTIYQWLPSAPKGIVLVLLPQHEAESAFQLIVFMLDRYIWSHWFLVSFDRIDQQRTSTSMGNGGG